MLKLTKILVSSTKGFTLIEILVSVTVLGLMTLGTISFSDFVMNTSTKNVADDRDFLQIEMAMSRLEFDISQLYSPLYFDILMNPAGMTPEEGEIYNQILDVYQRNQRFSQVSFNGLPVPIFESPEESEFIFLTCSNRRKVENSKQSRFSWVRYTLSSQQQREDAAMVGEIETEKSSRMTLLRQVYNQDVFNPQDIPWDDVKTQVLMRNVDSLKFEFWNPETQKWTENLNTIKNGIHKINAVKLSMNYFDIAQTQKYTERIFRPLFPEYNPEDMYRFLKPPVKKPQGDTP